MALDELSESQSHMFLDEREIKRREAEMRKEKLSSLCKRCRALRFENRAIEEKQDGEGEVHDATLLAPHVNSFDRKKVLRSMLQ